MVAACEGEGMKGMVRESCDNKALQKSEVMLRMSSRVLYL
jgi:hypothetical protein